jgi:Hypothetical glycosyl hydrolase family 15
VRRDSRRRHLGRRAGWAAACAVAAAVVVTGAVSGAVGPARESAEPRPAKPRVDAAPPAALKGTAIIRLGSSFHAASGYERFSYVVVDDGDALAAGVRRLPGKTLVYMNGTSLPERYFTGVSLTQATRRGWLLEDESGATIMNETYGHAVGDFGDPAYQQQFVKNVAARLKRTKNDGVFLDDVVAFPRSLTGGPLPTKYPTPEAWEDAMVGFVAAVSKGLRARGYYVLVNPSKFVGGDVRSDTAEHMTNFWKRLAPHADGLMCEYWLQNPHELTQMRAIGTAWYEYWSGWQSLVNVAQARGVDFFGLFYGATTDVQPMRYARANFLLDWDGAGGALMFEATNRADPFHPMWVKQVGVPVGRKEEVRPGVWTRRYKHALVIVNANKAPVSVRIGSKTHTIAPVDALFAALPRS